MKEYKYRHELKFKISESAAEVLKQKLSLIMGTDNNGYFDDGSYLIKSLYFDDLNSKSYYLLYIFFVLFSNKFLNFFIFNLELKPGIILNLMNVIYQ